MHLTYRTRSIVLSFIFLITSGLLSVKAQDKYDIQELSFISHGANISGSLVIANDVETVASIVYVHGSGQGERNIGLAKGFASNGIATLVYDKRGTGQSDGVYEIEKNISGDNLNLLSSDAVSAIEFLNGYPRLSKLPSGFVGFSQAGWIIPLAARRSQIPQFIALWSGPVCKVSEELMFSRYTGDQNNNEQIPNFELVSEAMRDKFIWPTALGEDIDPVDSLSELSIPGLWVFGGKDGSIPVGLSTSRLDALITNGKNNFEYVVDKKLGHYTLNGTFNTLVKWIKDNAQLKELKRSN